MSAQPAVAHASSSILLLREGRIEPMRVDHLVDVMQVEREAYPWPWSEGNIRDSIAQGHRCQALRSEGDQLMGYFIAMLGAQEVHLLNITVARAYQRQGWARVMLDHLIHWSRQHQAQWAWLEVRLSNERAISVYQQYGFRRVGMRKAYYPSTGAQREDALVMSMQL